MTVNPKQSNTLILAVLEQGGKAICVGNLVTEWGMEQETIIATGASALAVTQTATADARIIKARQIAIFSNSKPLVDLYTHPIRLPLRRPADLDKHYNERGGEYRKGMWITPAGYGATTDGQAEWEIMRNLCHFDRWQFRFVPIEQMKRTMELWEDIYVR